MVGEALKEISVEAIEYIRPHGEQRPGFIYLNVDDTDVDFIYEQLSKIEDCGLNFSIELIFGNTVNLCLEDQANEFDFLSVIINDNKSAIGKIIEIIKDFTVENYTKTKAMYVDVLE